MVLAHFCTSPLSLLGGSGPPRRLAGYADRVVAAAIDWAGPGLVVVLVHLPAGDPLVAAPVRLGVVVVASGWVVWNGIRQGRTGMSIGKERVGIRLVDRRTAAVVGPARSVLRWVARILDLVPLGAGLLLPLVDPAHQTVADKVTGTVVLEGRTPAPVIG